MQHDGAIQERRVISLLSATTEIVSRLGMAHCLVGRSHGCDDPALATTLPVVTAPKVDPNASSALIDAAVRMQAASGGPVYHIYNGSVKALQPDVIITQDQCRICAVTKDDVQDAIGLLGENKTQVVTVEPKTLTDVLGDVMTVAEACGVPERGTRLVNLMKSKMDTVQSTVAELTLGTCRPKVAHIEWIAPLMGSGYWIAECVDIGGGDMICGKVGGNSAVLEGLERLQEADVIILAPCGFSIERTQVELNATDFLANPAFAGLPAVCNGRCFVADGNKYFNRSSCGVVETAEMVAEMCHAELIGLWGHHGERFVNLKELDRFCKRTDAPPPTKAVPGPEASHGPQPSAEKFSCAIPDANEVFPVGAERMVLGPEDVVKAQLAALQMSDFPTAFEFNSEQNKARLSDSSKFGSIVKGTSFNILLDRSAIITTAAPVLGDQLGGESNSASVRVDAVSQDGKRGTFLFDVGKTSGKAPWQTEGVRVGC